MKDLYTVRKTCRLCNSSKIDLVLPIGFSPVSDKYSEKKDSKPEDQLVPLDVYMCENCGHVQILHVINPDYLWDTYHFKTSRNPKLVNHYIKYVNEAILTAKHITSKFHLDIGSNDGTLIKLFKDRNFKSIGVDCAKNIAEEANLNGLETIIKYMNKDTANYILNKHGRVDIITANNVYAHIDDMHSLTESIKLILDKKGLFIFEVSYLQDVINKRLIGTIFHEHLSYHSVKPLALFFKKNKLEIIKINKNELQGGSIVCFVQHINGPYAIDESVKNIIEEENKENLSSLDTVKKLHQDLLLYKKEINEILDNLIKQGKIIAGFGSAISATTFLSYFDIAKKIDFIVDDNKDKHFKFTPKFRIEVLPTKFMYERKNDCVIIFAWEWSEKIIENHVKYLDGNRSFLKIFPHVKLISKLNDRK